MLNGHSVGAVILMGGEGRRFGGQIPKQFLILNDRKIYLHTLETFQSAQIFDSIVLACHPDWLIEVQKEANDCIVVSGGATRQQSSYLGLKAFPTKPDIVVIHDAVRPFISHEIIKKNLEQAIIHGAVDTCIPSADTLVFAPEKTTIASVPSRDQYMRGQTPQTFLYECILNAHENAIKNGIENCSDDCQLVLKEGKRVQIVLGSESNIKITTEFDLTLAKILVESRQKFALV